MNRYKIMPQNKLGKSVCIKSLNNYDKAVRKEAVREKYNKAVSNKSVRKKNKAELRYDVEV